MLGVRFTLFSKIMLWFFLNLLLLALVLIFVFNSELRFSPRFSTNRLEGISHLITEETQDMARAQRDEILQRYSEAYQVEFFVFDDAGNQLAGRQIALPAEVSTELTKMRGPGPPPPLLRRNEPGNPTGRGGPPPRPPSPFFYVKTSEPALYWSGSPVFLFEKDRQEPTRARLVAASESSSGHGLFFDPSPWIILGLVIFGGSMLFWLPFVRHITNAVKQLTGAAEKIAEERFDVRVSEKRTDELGRLGKAINHLAGRLAGFVTGQKRFLGDISHELNSPLARMQFALSILEERVAEENRSYVEDVKEEVELMSKLVSELLTYSKAGIQAPHIKLEPVRLKPLIEQVVARETVNHEADVRLDVDDDLTASAQPDLLVRAVGNVVRNAIRYAGSAGEITISAGRNGGGNGGRIHLAIADRGTGVPESELSNLFDPFYRIETDRARQTGGSGLGLAIVKTCVEACEGKVTARNLKPQGFEVSISLRP
jgi:two-component system sensor histidine kinase CpxA